VQGKRSTPTVPVVRQVLSRFGVLGATTPVRPPGSRSLPDWFVANRVQGHTRLPLGPWHATPEFEQAAFGFKALGARAFARHVKSGDEDPWWPTAEPLGPDGRPLSDRDREINGVFIARGRSVAQEIIDEAHAEGQRIVTYYWHITEDSVANLHPEWVCRHPDGTPIRHDPRGIHLDITGPYREVVLTRLRELAALGVDCIEFDERHLPPDGCWGSALEDAWKAETGDDAAPHDETDPRYLRFIEFKAQKIEETFTYWRDEVKAAHPDCVVIISTTTIPALTVREMTTRLVRIADSPKNEYRLALNRALTKRVFVDYPDLAPEDHVRQALGWTILRDSAEGRPPRIWASGVPDAHHARAVVGSLLTFGCIANMDVDEQSLLGVEEPAEGKTPLGALRAAFALGAQASPHLAGTYPVRWAAVHFSEYIRNSRGTDYRAAWTEVLWPLVGSYQVLCEDGVPVGTVDDRQLEQGELDGYRLLVLPNADELTAAQQRAVAAFRARGGAVVENDPAWAWSDRPQRPAAAASFRAAVTPYIATAPLRVRGGPNGMYAVAYRGADKLVVVVTNDFSWVQITKRGDVLPTVNEPPPPVEGVQIAWGSGHGFPQASRFALLHRLRAVEVIRGTTLVVEQLGGTFRVSLPRFPVMAMLVVTRVPRFRRDANQAASGSP
jgi:hypothetical protein